MESNVTFNKVARVLVRLTLEDLSTKLTIASVRLDVERKIVIGTGKKCVLGNETGWQTVWDSKPQLQESRPPSKLAWMKPKCTETLEC